MKNNTKNFIGVDERVPWRLLIPLSIQHTLAMFGGTILIPIIMGVDPAIVLLMNGLGTLLFMVLTDFKSPAYLGSSGAFIAPAMAVIMDSNYGYPYALGGFVVVSLLGLIFSLIFRKFGSHFLDIILPPAAMGAIVALIGFDLIGYSVTPSSIGADLNDSTQTFIFFITLGTAVLGTVIFKKFFATIPILISTIIGYCTALYLGVVNVNLIKNAPILVIPTFNTPKFALTPILTILPVIFVVLAEHISHQIVTSTVIHKPLLKDPGLHKTLFADNLSSLISSFIGSVPTTTYGENIGVMAITKVYSVWVLAGAAIFSISMAFVGPFSAIIKSIPGPVIGGVTFLLYGMIGTAGLRLLVDRKVDYSRSRNLVLTSITFVVGLSKLSLNIGGVIFSGMVLASLVALSMGILFFIFDKINLMND